MTTLTELHNRLIVAESAIAALTAEVSRLTYNGTTMKTSVALRPAYSTDYHNRPVFQKKPYPLSVNDQEPISLAD